MTDTPSSSDKPRSRDEYSPEVVDRVFGLIEWLDDHHLSNTLFYSMAAIMAPAYWVFGFLLNRTRLHGKDRLPPEGTGFFLLSNHISMLDGQMITTVTLPRTYWFPSKAAFYRTNLQGLGYTVLTGFKSFPVRRGEKDLRAIDHVQNILGRGESVLLFPEGTRSRDGSLGTGKVGVGRIVHDAKPVVVPCYLEGLDEMLKRGKALPGIGCPGHIAFGDPIPMDDLFALPRERDTYQAIVDRVMDSIADLRDEVHASEEG